MKRTWISALAGGAAVLALSATAAAVSAPYLSPATSFGPITGSGNCSTNGTLEQPARDAADAQLAGFLATAARDAHTTALFPDADIGTVGATPYALPIANTDVTVSIALHNMTASDAGGVTATTAMSWGSPATGSAPDLIFGSTEQLQDCAPKPTRLVSTGEGGPLASPTPYWTVGGFGSAADQSTLDSVLFTFSEPVDNFGAWFGDLETRSDDAGGAGGELGFIKLYDASGAVLSVQPIVPTVQTPIVPGVTPFGCGGSSSADSSACGNHGTRFLGFTWDTPVVAAFQVIVGDDDNCNNVPTACDGSTERMSFIGPTYAYDNPELTFTKVVVNDNFGIAMPADFTFELTADPNGTPLVTTHTSGDTVELQIDTEYAVSEVASAGYTNTSATCLTDEGSTTDTIDVTVAPTAFTPTIGNSQFTCSFTNDDVAIAVPLTITKVVVNDEGGTSQPADFDLDVSIGGVASVVSSGSTTDLTSPAEVIVSETPITGYSLVSIECRDATSTVLANPFTPNTAMEAINCVVTNDDIAPTTTIGPPESIPPVTTIAPITTTTIPATTAPATTVPTTADVPVATMAPTTTTLAPSSTTPTMVLPATGTSTGPSLQLALGALALGAALIAATRRRTA